MVVGYVQTNVIVNGADLLVIGLAGEIETCNNVVYRLVHLTLHLVCGKPVVYERDLGVETVLVFTMNMIWNQRICAVFSNIITFIRYARVRYSEGVYLLHVRIGEVSSAKLYSITSMA